VGRSLAFAVFSDRVTLDAAWLFAAVVAVLVLGAVFLASRRFLLERGGGTVECGLRRTELPGAPWRLGVASYQLDELRWFTAFGISSRADEVFGRRDLTVISRRRPEEAEAAILGPDRVIVGCSTSSAGGTVELALADQALTGLLAWLEAAPPSSYLDSLSLTPAPRPT
jgi:Protein of unknown function (DUF2550)